MTEKAKRRPFWKVRRFYGGLCVGLAGILITIPGAPVIATVGTMAITVNTLAATFSFLGTFVLGYGHGKKVERESKE